jgi:hypothetical protein
MPPEAPLMNSVPPLQLRDAVAGDVRQAAELLETGPASLNRGTQATGRNGPG